MSLYHERWWLDAVAPSRWSEVTVSENGTVVGRFPFYEWQRLGFRCIGMPPLTRTLGPLVKPTDADSHKERQRKARIVRQLIQKLPSHSFFKQQLPPEFHNQLPFQFEGFSLSCEYSYYMDCRKNIDALWVEIPSKTKTMIRKARRSYTLRECHDPDELNRLYQNNGREGGGLSQKLLRDVYSGCISNNAGKILAAYNPQTQQMMAAILVAWSDDKLYYLLQSRHNLATNGAIESLIWEAVTLGNELRLELDLDGVASEEAARRMAQLGGYLRQRTVATRGHLLMASLRHMRREMLWNLGRRDTFL